MKKLYVYLLVTLMITACGNTARESVWERKQNQMEFPSKTDAATSRFPIRTLMSVREWQVDSNLLVCWNDNEKPCFYLLDINDFHAVDSFGVIGKGKNEWIAPHILIKANGELLLSGKTLNGIKILPEAFVYWASGRIFMPFRVLPDSNNFVRKRPVFSKN